jgi:uncharacterized membrane protein YccC
LNAALAEGVGTYRSRAATLGCVTAGSATGVFCGTLTARAGWWGVLILFVWVFVAAFAGVLGPVAERTGWFTALMFMIGLGLPHSSLPHAARYATLVLIGSVWAVFVITVTWPLHPHRPERRAIGLHLLRVDELLRLVEQERPPSELERAVNRAEKAGHEAEALTRWRAFRGRWRPEAARLHELVSRAELMCSYAVVLSQSRLGHDDIDAVRGLMPAVSTAAVALRRGHDPADGPPGRHIATVSDHVAAELRQRIDPNPALPLMCRALTCIAYPGRSDTTISPGVASRGNSGAVETLRANFKPSSFWFRYAVRFAAAAATGLAIGYALGLARGYWVLITIAAVVKPQLSIATTSTIQRVAGTVLGALLGAALVIALPDAWALIGGLFVLAVLAIALLRVNYGLGVVFLTPLVLVLLNVSKPGQWHVADVRVLNTLLGAAIGLIATTAILPGSERRLVVERSQAALTRSAAYLGAIAHDSVEGRRAARRAARVAIDDLHAVIDRTLAEPLPVNSRHLSAAARMGEATARLWEASTQLAFVASAGYATTDLRNCAEVGAQQVTGAARLLATRPTSR